MTEVYEVSVSIPRGPNTVSCRDSRPRSFRTIIPVAVRSLETDATRIIIFGCISSPASVSAHPYPFA